jgi:hypothetical protein
VDFGKHSANHLTGQSAVHKHCNNNETLPLKAAPQAAFHGLALDNPTAHKRHFERAFFAKSINLVAAVR